MHTYKNIIVVGLGKTGFSCVRFLTERGFDVVVVDSREQPPYLEQLRAQYPNIPIALGSFDSPFLNTASAIVISPGVAVHEAAFAPHIARGITVIGDIELFARAAHETRTPIIAITGSNGKSTVTTLAGAMAEAAGRHVKVGGNLGTPALDLLDASAQLYVLELSSFQLETTHSLQARVATVLNVTPDHIDRHGTFSKYCAAKWHIYDNCEVAVINLDDTASYSGAKLPARIIGFGLTSPNESEIDNVTNYQHIIDAEFFGFDGTCLFYCTNKENHEQRTEKLIAANELKIKGTHQIANALAALALGHAAGLPMTAMITALRTFSGLPHRCQWIENIDGVDWYNDSKATNVGAAEAAIKGLGETLLTVDENANTLQQKPEPKKLILIAGGLGKGADFTLLTPVVARYVKTAVLIGKDAPLLHAALSHCCKIVHAASMHDAVLAAASEAVAGDIALLSPACASFDMFDDFEHRGEVFGEEVLRRKRESDLATF